MLMNQTMQLEVLGELPSYLGVGIQIITAVILGGMVGYDREKKMKAAGLKTNILICLGATLYTTMSIFHLKSYGFTADPNRVGAQIVSGIGFLGAGAIIRGGGSVVGLTTAATIWTVAAIGYTIGAGYFISATLFSVTILVVLKGINPLYRYLEREDLKEYFHLEVLFLGTLKNSIIEMINQNDVHVDEIHENKIDKNKSFISIYLHGHPRVVDRLCSDIKSVASVQEVSFHQIKGESKISIKENIIDLTETGAKKK